MLRASLAVCGLLAAAPSCPDLYSVTTHGFAVPALESRGAKATAETRGLVLTVNFWASNPNPYPLELSGVEYDVAMKGTPVFSGSQGELSVSEHGEALIGLPGIVDSSAPVLRTLHPGDLAPFTVTGIAHVKTPAGVRVDVEFSTDSSFIVPAEATWGATR